MMAKVFLFDMDEVLVGLIGHWLGWLNRKYGINVQPADVTSWALHTAAPITAAGLTMAQVYDDLFNDADFWDTVPAIPGLKIFINNVKVRTTAWYIVTSPANGLAAQMKYEWLARELGVYVARNHLIIASSKEAVYGDLLVDDRDDNVVKFLDRWHQARALIPVYSHLDKNKLLRFGDRVTYISNPMEGDPEVNGPKMFREILDKMDSMLEAGGAITPRMAGYGVPAQVAP